jgi:4-aminobutyrate aminotransferase/(S)-3-amino-2-methylpropionate transaminase
MVAIDFADPADKSPLTHLAKDLLHEAFERKLLLLTCGTYGNVVRIIPPLITTDEEVDHALAIIAESIAALSQKEFQSRLR